MGRRHYNLWNGLGWKGSAKIGIQRFLSTVGQNTAPLQGSDVIKYTSVQQRAALILPFHIDMEFYTLSALKRPWVSTCQYIFVSLTAKHHLYGLHWTKLSETRYKPGSSTSTLKIGELFPQNSPAADLSWRAWSSCWHLSWSLSWKFNQHWHTLEELWVWLKTQLPAEATPAALGKPLCRQDTHLK